MSTQYSRGGETVESAGGQESQGAAAATGSAGGYDAAREANAGGAESSGSATGASELNWGSARSDYGENAYGGSLDERGMGGKGYDDFSKGRGDRDDNYGMPALRKATGGADGVGVKRRGGYSLETGSTGLTLLAGMVMGATLMYLLDPQQGRRRRALLRDKLVGLSNDAACALGKTSRDLRNRAQGVIAETTKAMGLRGGEGEAGAGGTGYDQAGAASAVGGQ